MKSLFLLFLICHRIGFGQSPAHDYFETASRMYRSDYPKIALHYFEKALALCDTNKLIRNRSLYNIGYIHYEQKHYDTALIVFSTILESNLNDFDPNNLMEVYANYKHNSCEIISEIWGSRGDYKKALHYFSLADTAYPYRHFCGNEMSGNSVHKACRYADLYKLTQNDKNIEPVLLPCIFIDLADNTEIIDRLKTIFEKENIPRLKFDFYDSIHHMYSKTGTGKYGSYRHYYFKFHETEILVPFSYSRLDEKDDFDLKEAIDEILTSDFYKMLNSLH